MSTNAKKKPAAKTPAKKTAPAKKPVPVSAAVSPAKKAAGKPAANGTKKGTAKKPAPAAGGKPSAIAKGKAPAKKSIPSPAPLKDGAKSGASANVANKRAKRQPIAGDGFAKERGTASRINGNPESEKHIRRIDTSPNAPKQTHGYQVALYMNGQMHTKMFSDNPHGGNAGALKAARAHRDNCMASPDYKTPKNCAA